MFLKSQKNKGFDGPSNVKVRLFGDLITYRLQSLWCLRQSRSLPSMTRTTLPSLKTINLVLWISTMSLMKCPMTPLQWPLFQTTSSSCVSSTYSGTTEESSWGRRWWLLKTSAFRTQRLQTIIRWRRLLCPGSHWLTWLRNSNLSIFAKFSRVSRVNRVLWVCSNQPSNKRVRTNRTFNSQRSKAFKKVNSTWT